jgi:hypothetical protein
MTSLNGLKKKMGISMHNKTFAWKSLQIQLIGLVSLQIPWDAINKANKVDNDNDKDEEPYDHNDSTLCIGCDTYSTKPGSRNKTGIRNWNMLHM